MATIPARILLVTNTLVGGGAETLVRDLAVRFARRGATVGVAVLLRFRSFGDELDGVGIRTFEIGADGARDAVRIARRLSRVLDEFAPDIVHSHLSSSILAVRVVSLLRQRSRSRCARPVLVETTHASFEKTRWKYWMYRVTDGIQSLWTSVCSESIAAHEAAGAIRRGTGVCVPNGVDLSVFRPTDAGMRAATRAEFQVGDAFAWLAVGSFRDGAKDYGNLLHAFVRHAVGRGKDEILLIAGDGILRPRTEELARRLGLLDRVRFLGFRTDVPRLLAAADGYVMSSAWEAMPMVLLEAGAAGVPAVVTDVGANRDIVVDGVTGFVVPPRDPVRLGEAMARLAALPSAERQSMGAQARERVRTYFDIERVADAWIEVYQSLLTSGAPVQAFPGWAPSPTAVGR
jgi:glycosyltransferase involved in cell wall biosynthesis